jgi:hypothetical protein
MAPPATPGTNLGKSLAKGEPFSKEWPYDIRYSAVAAAPANHTVRYGDDHVELIEVAVRQGERENMHGHPYPSVYVDDGGFIRKGVVYDNQSLVGAGPPWGKMTTPLDNVGFPICFSAVPEAPHAVKVVSGTPAHFYRIHFKRVDGDDIKTNWSRLYPARP